MRASSIQSRPLSLRLRHFWSHKKGSEGQTIHLGRRRLAVRAELVHNAAPGILRDNLLPPCVAMRQVPQQPGPIPDIQVLISVARPPAPPINSVHSI